MGSLLLDRLKDINSVYLVYPEKIETLVSNMRAEIGGDIISACAGVIKTFREKQPPYPAAPAKAFSADVVDECDRIMDDTFTIYNETVTMARDGNGCYDWNTKGLSGDYNWGLLFNRHEYFYKLVYSYEMTGDIKYINKTDEIIRNWTIANPKPSFRSHEDLEWNQRPWRTLEAAIRLVVWTDCFYKIKEHLSDAAVIFILSGIIEHCHHIMNFTAWPRHDYPNIYATEILGLAYAGVHFSEFALAKDWIAFAKKAFYDDILIKQVYPDGVHKEMSTGYHVIAAKDFEQINELLLFARGREGSDDGSRIIESMWEYVAKSVKPDGTMPQNGDTDLVAVTELIREKAEKYGHPEWMDFKESITFPWGGISIIRDKNFWCFFDIGAHGTSGHGHRDKLHISLYYRRDILVDTGRYLYNFNKWLDYYRDGSRGHNTLLINGCSQCKGEEEYFSPIGSYGPDFAEGVFSGGYYRDKGDNNTAVFFEKHRREIKYKNKRLIVRDTVETKGCDVEMPWHFHPDCTLCRIGNAVYTNDDGKGNIMIIPPDGFRLDIVSGAEEPYIQGWYSNKYGEKTVSPTAVYTSALKRTTSFKWEIICFDGRITDGLKLEARNMTAGSQVGGEVEPINK